MTRSRIAAVLLALLTVAAAERSGPEFALDPELVARSFRPFEDNVSVRWDDEHFYVESSGMPRHPMMVGIRAWNGQVPIPQPYKGNNAFRFTLRPRFAATPVSARETLFRGAIAIAANGVPIFNPIKQDGRTDTYLAGELDDFGGHAGRADDYHYHTAPVHLADQIGTGLPLAWALDGFPLFGYIEADGSAVQGLDWLNGHSGPDGLYHYHASPDYPRVNGGFRGRIELREGQVAVQPRTRAIRPSTRPIRGATITHFDNSGEGSYRLELDFRGQRQSVSYTLLPAGGAEFLFTDSSGLSRSETYAKRVPRGGRQGRDRGPGNTRPPQRRGR
ncbi:MAG: YHYH protein [Acidobacteriia bacterium]|nr:YHYH protein [Terriglobia bacterium]MYK10054.1 YHYH protein [Terriglobia bacterium]